MPHLHHPDAPAPTMRVAFVKGTTPDKWAARWREQRSQRLELMAIEVAEQRAVLDEGRADMVLARLPLEDRDLHVVRLYEELPVAVVSRDHAAAAYESVSLADLADEQFVLGVPEPLTSEVAQLAFPPMSQAEAIEVAASGSGVAVVPMSVARHYHRKDVAHVTIEDLAPTQVVLAWLRERDGDDTQAFVGVVKGRTARSSR